MKGRIIFFDLDGTLIDIEPRHYRIYAQTVKKMGGTVISRESYWDQKRRDVSWGVLLKQSGIAVKEEEAFLKYFISHIENDDQLARDSLFPDSVRVLNELMRDNVLYLLSLRRNPEGLNRQVEQLGITPYFKGILSGHSDTKTGVLTKKADIIRSTEESFDRVVVIGDTEADVMAAHDVGGISIAVTSGIRNHNFLSKLDPTYLIKGVAGISALTV